MPSPESLRRRMWCVAISFVAVVTGGHAFAQPASPPESAGTTPAGSAYRPAGRASIYSTLSRTSSDDGTSKGESALNTSLNIAFRQSALTLLPQVGRRDLPVEVRPQILYNPAMRSPNFFVPGVIEIGRAHV